MMVISWLVLLMYEQEKAEVGKYDRMKIYRRLHMCKDVHQ